MTLAQIRPNIIVCKRMLGNGEVRGFSSQFFTAKLFFPSSWIFQTVRLLGPFLGSRRARKIGQQLYIQFYFLNAADKRNTESFLFICSLYVHIKTIFSAGIPMCQGQQSTYLDREQGTFLSLFITHQDRTQ